MATCSNIKKYTYLYMRAGSPFCVHHPRNNLFTHTSLWNRSDHLMIPIHEVSEIFLLFCYINYTFVLIKIVSFPYLLSSLGPHLGMEYEKWVPISGCQLKQTISDADLFSCISRFPGLFGGNSFWQYWFHLKPLLFSPRLLIIKLHPFLCPFTNLQSSFLQRKSQYREFQNCHHFIN